MRNLHLLDVYRDTSSFVESHFGGSGDETCGLFRIPSPIDRRLMVVIASSGMGWDHVSVSRQNRCPNWPEMDYVKDLFFRDDETVMQLHVPRSEHVNFHPHCLHLWRPVDGDIPRPPAYLVGPVVHAEAAE